MKPRVPLGLPALVILLLALAGPGHATTLGEQEFQCSLCGKDFKDRVLRSTNVMERDSELRPYAGGLQPLPYLVHACPYCGFTDGDHRARLDDKEKGELIKFLASYCQKHNCKQLSPAEKYEVVAEAYQIRRKPARTIALMYHRAAWMADDAGDAGLAKAYREKSRGFLIQALKGNQVPAKEVPVITYLVGELNRRLGNFPAALEWYGQIKDPDPQLAKILEQQKGLARKQDAAKAKLPPLK